MSQLFSTELLPASDRVDAWQWNAQQICGDCRIRLPKDSFHGSIDVRHVCELPLTRFSSSPISFWKWPLDTVTSQNRSCIVITQIAGARRYRQDGDEVLLMPGDSTVVDSARPWSSTCGTDCVRLYLRMPRWTMEDRLRTRAIPIARKISGGTSLGADLSRLVLTLYDDGEWMNEEEVASALDSYFEILAGCIGEDAEPSAGSSDLNRRILRFLDTHISDPALGPSRIASALGISVRHLHRVFSCTGNTLGEYIRTLRLERCREDLSDSSFEERSITEIAFSRGFSDAAHFSHSFRKQFGVSPRAFRTETKIQGRQEMKCDGGRPPLHTHIPAYSDSRPN